MTAYQRRGFSGAAKQTSLSGDINDAVTTITGADLSTWAGLTSTGPGTATISEGDSDEEVITFTGISGNDLTGVTRGAAGTTQQSHTSGAKLNHTSSKIDFDEANAHIADTTLDHHAQYAKTDGSRAIAPTSTSQVSWKVNAPSGQTADLLQLQVNGATKSRFIADGSLQALGADHYVGPYSLSTGTSVSRLHFGLTSSAAVISAEGDGSDRSMIVRSKGASPFQVQKGDGTATLQVDTDGGVGMMAGSLLTNTAVGFFYVRYMNGTPSGTPSAVPAGSVPLVYDIGANKLWVYNGAWKSVTLS